MKLTTNSLMMVGYHALKRRGEIVWIGPLGAPIEDAECDEIIVAQSDYERIRNEIAVRRALSSRDQEGG